MTMNETRVRSRAMSVPAASGPTVRDAFIAAPAQTIARGSASRGTTSCTTAE